MESRKRIAEPENSPGVNQQQLQQDLPHLQQQYFQQQVMQQCQSPNIQQQQQLNNNESEVQPSKRQCQMQQNNVFPNSEIDEIPSTSTGLRYQHCGFCNVQVPTIKWFRHCKTNIHKENSSVVLSGNMSLIRTDFKNRIASYQYKSTKDTIDIDEFFIGGKCSIMQLLANYLSIHHILKFNFEVFGEYVKISGEDVVLTYIYHPTQMTQLTRADNMEDFFENHVQSIKAKMSEFQERDSGWALTRIAKLEININKSSPLKGSHFIITPTKLLQKKAIINVINKDEYCFKWCMIAALTTPAPANRRRTSSYNIPDITAKQIVLQNGVVLNFEGLRFPMALKDIAIFEAKNPSISVNVFGYDYSSNLVVGPFYITKMEKEEHHNLLLLERGDKAHYTLVTDTSRYVN